MSVESDLLEIERTVHPLLGKQAWGASLGVGSFVTLEFGRPLPATAGRSIHGEWHLWIRHDAWRIERGMRTLTGSEDDRMKMEAAIRQLEGRTLWRIEVVPPAFDTTFHFDTEMKLRLFAMYTEEYEHWVLFTPEAKVLRVGPGTTASYESASDP